MTELATRPVRGAQHIAGPVEIVLDWDGRAVERWTVDEWTPELARGTFDVGATTFCAVAYSVPHAEPDGRLVARIYVQPEYPPRVYRMNRSLRGIRTSRTATGRWASGAA